MRRLLIVLFVFSLSALLAKSITFRNENMMMDYGPGWMFNLRPNHWFNENIGAFTAYPVYVYESMSYNMIEYSYSIEGTTFFTPLSTSTLTGFSYFPPLNGTTLPDENIKLYFGERYTDDSFRLCAYTHINTLNGDNDWKTLGAAGDKRTYADATVYIKSYPEFPWEQEELLLQLNNCCISSVTAYGSPLGTDAGITGYGWGTLDPVNGNPQWISEWTNQFGQVLFTFSSSSAVVQDLFGLYNSDITLTLPTSKRDLVHAMEVDSPYTLDALDTHGVALTVESGDYIISYWDNTATNHNSSICKYYSASIGNYPAHIVNHYDGAYWEIGNTFDHSTSTIVFDFSNVPGVDNPENLRVLRRTNGYGVSWYDTNAALISLNPLRFQVSGYDIMGEYCLASTGGNNFIISFPRNVSISRIQNAPNDLQLSWEPVVSATGYKVYSAPSADSPESEWVLEASLEEHILMWESASVDSKRFYFVKAVKN